jgi:putative transcriptional regulator
MGRCPRTRRRIRAAVAAASLALLPAAGSSRPALSRGDREVVRLRPGVFLFAAPELTAPSFVESVVVLFEYGSRGAAGLIVNRPTEILADKVVPEMEGKIAVPLHYGGPVGLDLVLVLLRSPEEPPESLRVVDDVYFTGSIDTLQAAVRKGDPARTVRVYAGHAGWAPGQLENEVRQGLWVVAPARPRMIFADDPSTVWPEVYRLLGAIEARDDGRGRSPDRSGRSRGAGK